jgi:hypothetical protein
MGAGVVLEKAARPARVQTLAEIAQAFPKPRSSESNELEKVRKAAAVKFRVANTPTDRYAGKRPTIRPANGFRGRSGRNQIQHRLAIQDWRGISNALL